MTSTGGALALDASIQALINAVKANVSIEGSLWVDVTVNPAVYYVRRETWVQSSGTYTVSWQTPAGVAATPTVSNLQAVGQGEALATENTNYVASAGGTGYSASDILIHTFGIDTSTSPASLAFSFWFNATTGLVMGTPPTNGTYASGGGGAASSVSVTGSVLPTNAAQETGGNLTAIAQAHGTTADAAYAGSGNASMMSALKGLFPKLAGPLTATLTGALPAGGNNIGAVNVAALPALPVGTNAIGSVTVTATTLAANAAQETGGHLATLDAVQGTVADVAYAGSGGSTIIAALKGLYTKLAGTLTTTLTGALPAGANALGTVGVTALPTLPSGTNTLGAVTAPGAVSLALDSSIQTLINTIKATVGVVGTVWFDPTVNPPVYYVRRETVNEGTGAVTVTWVNPDGTVATPSNLAKLQISGDAQNLQPQNVLYTVSGAATGIAVNDIVIHALAIDRSTSTPTVAYNFWINATQGTVLASAPASGNIAQSTASSVTVTSSALPNNAAQETGGHLATLEAAQGGVADAAWSGTGTGTVISVLKALWGRLTGVQYIIASDGVFVPVDSLAQTLGYDGSGNLTTVAVQYGGHTYTQTMSYTANVLQTTTNWVMS